MSITKRRNNRGTAKTSEPQDHVWKDEEQKTAGPVQPKKLFFPLTINQTSAAAEYEGDEDTEFRLLLQSIDGILKDGDCADLKKIIRSGFPVYVYILGSKEALFRFYSLGKQTTDYVVLHRKEAENGRFYILVPEPGARKVERVISRLSGKDDADAVLKTQQDLNLRAATNEELFFEGLVMEELDQLGDPEPFDGRTRHTFQGWRFIGKGFGQKEPVKKGNMGKKPVSYI